MPRVSAIIPCYNTGRYLAEAVESVLAQTFADYEIVIVDDGSTDNTSQVARDFSDGRIRIIHQENKGLPGARNTGILASTGEYVAFLDADDWFLPHKLERQVGFLDEHPEVGLVASGWVDTNEQGQRLRTVEPWRYVPHLDLPACIRGMPLIVHAVLVRRCWLEAVKLFDETMRWCEDWDLWLRLIAAGCTFAWLPEIVCRYRIHGDNMVFDVRRMRDGGLRALEKLFARPDLPAEVRVMEKLAHARVHLSAAARAYGQGAVDEGKENVLQAIQHEPSLLIGTPCRVIKTLVGWANNPVVGDTFEYLDALVQHLPAQPSRLRRQARRQMADQYMSRVFSAYEVGDWDAIQACLGPAFWLRPRWLLNLGVLSITARTLLPGLRREGSERYRR